MAAIDPHEEVIEPSNSSLVTLRIVREHNDNYEDSDLYMQNLLSGCDSEDESDEDDQNGGPSDLSKSKKARKTTAVQELVKSLAEDDSNEELESDPNRLKADKKGKSKFSSDDRDESDNSDNETELEEFVVCTIDTHKVDDDIILYAKTNQSNKNQKYQQPLDITIGKNELVYFKVRGNHTVYLTGNYLIPDELVRSGSIESDDSDANSEYDLTPDENELELELDEESDELDDLDNPRITELDDSDDGLVSQPTKDAEKKKGKNKRSADQIEDENSLEGMMAKSMKSASTEEPKLSKKQLKKLKKNNGQAANPNADSSTKDDKAKAKREIEEISKKNNTEKNDKKVQFAKNLEQGPTGSADKEKTEQTTNQNKASLGIKTVDGVKIDDKKLGSGRACKNGDKVLMRYIGKLPNGYVFDCEFSQAFQIPQINKIQQTKREHHSVLNLEVAK